MIDLKSRTWAWAVALVFRIRHLLTAWAISRANVGTIRNTSKSMFLVQPVHLTFGFGAGRKRVPNVRWAALAAAMSLAGCNAEQQRSDKPTTAAGTQSVAFTVAPEEVDDLKAVLATVRSKKVVEARVRTPGTVATLSVAEGEHVEPGQVLSLVTDPKIALRIKASDAQIIALQSRLETAKAEFDRAAELLRRGVASQSRLDQTKTAFDVASNELDAAKAERSVIEKQAEEGQVLAPSAGRVLRVPFTEGSVVMVGESIASIAANDYLLRLEVPERHARFMQKGDPIMVGSRSLDLGAKGAAEGRVVEVYPEIQGGRVIADAEVPSLGSYFVGERALTWISAGKRSAILVPRDLVFTRFGIDYVRIAVDEGPPSDVVVQLGRPGPDDGSNAKIEVLSGLKSGDRLVQP